MFSEAVKGILIDYRMSVDLSFPLFVCLLRDVVGTYCLLSVGDSRWWFVEKKIAIFYLCTNGAILVPFSSEHECYCDIVFISLWLPFTTRIQVPNGCLTQFMGLKISCEHLDFLAHFNRVIGSPKGPGHHRSLDPNVGSDREFT